MLKKKCVEWFDRAVFLWISKVWSHFDYRLLHKDVPLAGVASHSRHLEHLAKLYNKNGMRILEIGSREVTGASQARKIFSEAEYVGFDYYSGPNVDVVGDAHKLSSLVEGPFDLIYSSAVFEHLAMPWVASPEIAKLLKVGGMVMIETHFSYASHERPWHFFQFSDMALRALFPPAMGFECVDAGMSNPMVGRFSRLADPYLRHKPISGLYCHSDFLGRKTRDVPGFTWQDLNLDEVVGDTAYPEPEPAE